jgi:hypothetical protein
MFTSKQKLNFYKYYLDALRASEGWQTTEITTIDLVSLNIQFLRRENNILPLA